VNRTTARVFASVLAALVTGCDDNSNDRLLDAGAGDLGSTDVSTVDRGVADVGIADAGADVALDRGAATDVGTDAGAADAGAADAARADGGATDVVANDVGTSDAGGAEAGAADAGSADAGSADAGSADAGSADAGSADAGSADAGSARGTPIIDGVIGSDWPAGAIVATNAVPSEWGPALNALRSVRVAWDAERLYLGIDGVVEATNAMLVFVDRDYLPGMTATGVTAISTLTDGVGALDNSVSCNITEAPAGFGTDMVWGTRGMLRKSATELNESIGLRDLTCATCRSDFRWTPGDTAVCVGGATPACEVAIPWTALYGGAPPPVPMLGLFVRITDAEGASLANNQCLPQQGATDPPTAARRVLAFSPTF
jgi:hypothetical protein